MVVRRRYYYWLLKAYFKKWGKIIFFSVFLGGIVFLLLLIGFSYFFLPLVSDDIEKIGITGSYTASNLPEDVLEHVSYGLTKVSDTQEIKPAASRSWKVSKDGKIYTIQLKKGQKLSNNKELTVEMLPYRYKDVTAKIIDPYTLEYHLKNEFAPFLAVLERPILIKNDGLGDYKITKISQESGFVKQITLSKKGEKKRKIYYFYPTQEALKTAFMLGEIDQAEGISKRLSPESDFKFWKQTEVSRKTDYGKLVSLFFNTKNDNLGNKKIRQALSYALPEDFDEGERTYSYIKPQSIYYAKSPNEGIYDLDLAKSLLDASSSAKIKLEISTSEELEDVAKKIQGEWKKIGVDSQIKTVSAIPDSFEVLLYSMNLPKDPDMYMVWHSGQPGNLTNYSNVRIDKLLEDGRQTVNLEQRQAIYADVQKYLIDDAPTAFLYFPYTYTLKRK